ncbi:MAG: hypothetical protein KC636_19665, partial [Myxococcales bacterium]|nr:hypothetical protein [Myxococcales bacterium]
MTSMKPILLVYATRQGHARAVAEHIGRALEARGYTAQLADARDCDASLDLEAFGAAILTASVHLGKHEKEMVKFVRAARPTLERIPAAFLSVSLTEANAEMTHNPPEKRSESARMAAEMMDAFFEETGWHPARAQPVAGALLYSRYNVLVRWMMRRIARSEGGDVDTSRDHVYTDWEALDRFVEAFVRE